MTPRLVGLTGGIGSGKSTVAHLLMQWGYPVYVADQRARELMRTNKDLRIAITEAFGHEAYLPDGSPNRVWLAQQVFQNPGQLARLNALVHPAVASDTEHWLTTEATRAGKPLAFKEAAILFESGAYRHCTGGVLYVWAPRWLRTRRVMRRDGTTLRAVHARMRNQWPDGWLRPRADWIIYSNGSRALEPQLMAALRWLAWRNGVTLPA